MFAIVLLPVVVSSITTVYYWWSDFSSAILDNYEGYDSGDNVYSGCHCCV